MVFKLVVAVLGQYFCVFLGLPAGSCSETAGVSSIASSWGLQGPWHAWGHRNDGRYHEQQAWYLKVAGELASDSK